MSPSLGGLRVTKKLKKKSKLFQNRSFQQKQRKYSKKELQKVSKRVRGFRGKRFLGHLWSPKLIFDAKSEPTAPPKCPQGPKHASKMIPKGPKMILKVTLKVYSLGTLTLDRRFEQRPGGLREALTITSLTYCQIWSIKQQPGPLPPKTAGLHRCKHGF